MSPLIMIKRATQRRSRLQQAQFLMAKAYRGIPYACGPGVNPNPSTTSTKRYRGLEYHS